MLENLLKDLISINSSIKEEANRAIEYCHQWMSGHNLPSEIIENNGYKMAVCEIGSGDQTVIFNGHVDVVSGKDEQFIPVEIRDKIYGRGAADMKAGVAAMMCAVKELHNQPIGVKIQLQIVSDEEIGGFNCSGYLAEQGYRGDFVICSEPTQLGIALEAKGVIRLDIEIEGDPAHGSRPWEGVSAIEKAFEVHQNLIKLPFAKESSEFYPYPSINLAKINGGDVYNKVPEKCVMSYDIRYLPTQNHEDVIKQIESITDGEVIVNMFSKPLITKRDNPFILMLEPIVEKYTEDKAVFFGQHGSADTVFFANYGIPAIEFGPSGMNWHGDKEYVLPHSVHIYEKMLIDFAMKFSN
ncbi:M20 family metallopeptidase [Bacillus sp. J33]|uniref:M20 family metallopeptidase n=1 Tax=Bacillus sp. J33 TaxID=935836 RepID=UPI00047B56F4|nr:M20/M25/M40 family metallo-hydrolase [Bacillus sp. J33]